MKIGIDYDDTLVHNPAVEVAAKNLGITDYPVNYSYDLRELTPEHIAETRRLFINPSYMNNLQAIPGASEQLDNWKSKGHEIIVITARCKELESGTRTAIEEDFPAVDKIIFTDDLEDDKTGIMKREGINVWIDDRSFSAVAASVKGIETYLICNEHTLHNINVRNIFSNRAVNSISDIVFDTIKLNCYHCHARLKPTVYDIKDRLNRSFIECIYCGNPVNIPSSNIPNNWRYILYKE